MLHHTLALLALGACAASAQDGPDLNTLLARNQVILANLPTTGDRSERLRGVVEVANSPAPFMKALPVIMSGDLLPIAASLAAYDRLRGNEQPQLHDVWIKGRVSLPAEPEVGRRLGTLSTGADYLVTDNLLLGGFVQSDARASMALAAFNLGAFGTARLGENFYLDFVGARSDAGPWSEGRDSAANWLMTTALTGKWTAGQWTFSPQARMSYFAALSPALLDADGATRAAQRKAVSELAVGPSVSYKLTTINDVVLTTGLKLDTAAKLAIDNGTELAFDSIRGGLEGTFNVELPTGTRWKSSFGYQGMGQERRVFNATGSLTVPLR